MGQGPTKDLLQPRNPPNVYWKWGRPSLEPVYGKGKGLGYLISFLCIFEPLKIFYGQKVAHMYIGKKEAILENVYAKY